MITANRRSLGFRLRQPPTTVRWRLTLLYGGLFLVCGAGLLAVTYALVAHAPVTRGPSSVFGRLPPGGPRVQVSAPPGNRPPSQTPVVLPPGFRRVLRSSAGRAAVTFVGVQQRISDLHQLEIESAIALAIMALMSGLLGWLVAGRVLRPLRTITAATQEISEANLHQRLALAGPRDELRQLADTIDGLLERLQGAFDAQRQFVANASHELRTPLTAARALLEMAITDPNASVEVFRETCQQVLQENEQQEQLIDALLSLAQAQRGPDGRELIDLQAMVSDEMQRQELDAAARGLRVERLLEPAPMSGDRRLVQRLVSNLLDNAIRHNTQDGVVRVAVKSEAGEATLEVANTGPSVPLGEITRLLQPFQRLSQERTGHGDGLGLGLSIVAAIAGVHGAKLELDPRTGGGLDITVRFPQVVRDDALEDEERRSPGALVGANTVPRT